MTVMGFFSVMTDLWLTAAVTAALVILLRCVLRRCPRRCLYILWAAVFFRCLCPVSAESGMSIFNLMPRLSGTFDTSETTVETTVAENDTPPVPIYSIEGNITAPPVIVHEQGAEQEVTVTYADIEINTAENVSSLTVNESESVSTEMIVLSIWLTGAVIMLLYGVISYTALMKRVSTAIRTDKGVYESDRINTAFAGLFPMAVYIPAGLSEEEKRLITAHERTHIKRLDPLKKAAAFIGLSVNWFDPLIWISFALMTRDMELSCDEDTLARLGEENKKAYSMALLTASMKQSGIFITPAFGEKSAALRIKNALSYKKPGLAVTALGAAAVLTACGVLMTDEISPENSGELVTDAPVMESVAAESEDTPRKGTSRITGSSGGEIYITYGYTPKVRVGLDCVNGAYTEFDTVFCEVGSKNGSGGFGGGVIKDGEFTITADESLYYDPDYVEEIIINDGKISQIDGSKCITLNMTFVFDEEYDRNDKNVNILKSDDDSGFDIYRIDNRKSSVRAEFIIPDEGTPSVMLFGYDNAQVTFGEDIKAEFVSGDELLPRRHYDLEAARDENELSEDINYPLFFNGEQDGIRMYSYINDDDNLVIFEHDGTVDVFDKTWLNPRLIFPEMYTGDFDRDGEKELAVIYCGGTGTGISISDLVIYKIGADGHYRAYEADSESLTAAFRRIIEVQTDYESMTIRYSMDLEDKGSLIVSGSISDYEDLFLNGYPDGVTAEDISFDSITEYSIEGDNIRLYVSPGLMTLYYGFPTVTADIIFSEGDFSLQNIGLYSAQAENNEQLQIYVSDIVAGA